MVLRLAPLPWKRLRRRGVGRRLNATCLGLDSSARENAERCANYPLAKRNYFNYRKALEEGWPIALGVIDGSCQHLVKDCLDLTDAHWVLKGAEAILKVRALPSNGDFDE